MARGDQAILCVAGVNRGNAVAVDPPGQKAVDIEANVRAALEAVAVAVVEVAHQGGEVASVDDEAGKSQLGRGLD